MLLCVFKYIRRRMILDRHHRSSPGTSSHIAYHCDASTTDETDESSEFNSPRRPTRSGVMSSRSVHVPEGPHYQFRKSNSMKLALREEDEEGCYVVVIACMQYKVSGSRYRCFLDVQCFVFHFFVYTRLGVDLEHSLQTGLTAEGECLQSGE